MEIYAALDWFFIFFHSAWTVFNISGWAFRRTRRVHLITVMLTAFSWFICGYFYGWGYCICTDWHWRVREILGKENASYSFIDYAIRGLTGLTPDPHILDMTVLSVFLAVLFLSIFLNIRDFRKAK